MPRHSIRGTCGPAEKPHVGALAAFREVQRAQDEAKVAQLTTFPQGLTITGRNMRLRLERKKAWRAADRLTKWWRARVDWLFALEIAQMDDVGDAKTYASVVHGERFVLLDLWRAALVSQILTPAPNAGAVAWKRVSLRHGAHHHVAIPRRRCTRQLPMTCNG